MYDQILERVSCMIKYSKAMNKLNLQNIIGVYFIAMAQENPTLSFVHHIKKRFLIFLLP